MANQQPGEYYDWEKLREPFPPDDIEWRVARCGVTNQRPWAMVLAYITARAIHDRLDAVIGPQNWRNEFLFLEQGVLCGISVRVGSEWVTKWNGADATDVEPFKGALSAAEKRAAVEWGIGRYLYDLEENFADVTEKGRYTAYDKTTNTRFRWNPPVLPDWAVPSIADSEEKNAIDSEPPEPDDSRDRLLEELRDWDGGVSDEVQKYVTKVLKNPAKYDDDAIQRLVNKCREEVPF